VSTDADAGRQASDLPAFGHKPFVSNAVFKPHMGGEQGRSEEFSSGCHRHPTVQQHCELTQSEILIYIYTGNRTMSNNSYKEKYQIRPGQF